eukprot:RCo034318
MSFGLLVAVRKPTEALKHTESHPGSSMLGRKDTRCKNQNFPFIPNLALPFAGNNPTVLPQAYLHTPHALWPSPPLSRVCVQTLDSNQRRATHHTTSVFFLFFIYTCMPHLLLYLQSFSERAAAERDVSVQSTPASVQKGQMGPGHGQVSPVLCMPR